MAVGFFSGKYIRRMYTIHMNSKNKQTIISTIILVVTGVIGAVIIRSHPIDTSRDTMKENVILSGTYVCLPHIDTSGPQTQECAFGFETDDGIYYAVNFGASENAMQQFQGGMHITAKGFVVAKESLSSDQWAKYTMQGMFTITQVIQSAQSNGKLNINEVCQSALSYMTFLDSASADAFVLECTQGKHPEVIEQFKAQMNLGDGAAI